MLLSLNVNNYAIIDKLNIDFDEGLNIITGETGAGKSIIIGALSLVLGQKARLDNIKTGADKASIQAMFTLPNNNELKELLDELLIDYSDDSLILSREISVKGRNVCRINSSLVNVSTLKQVGSYLIDIHGQNEHQKLLNPKTHLSFLDSYGYSKIFKDLEDVQSLYNTYKKNLKEYNDVIALAKSDKEDYDRFKREFDEIDEIELQASDEEELLKREKILVNSQNIHSDINSSYSLLNDNDPSVSYALSEVEKMLSNVYKYDEGVKESLDMVSESKTLIDEVIFTLRDYKDSLVFDPNELNEIESKLNKINNLKKKYGATILDILEYKEQLVDKLDLINNYDEKIISLKERLNNSKKEYIEKSKILSTKRKEIAKEFCDKVSENLEILSMKGTVFTAKFIDLLTQEKFSSHGIDDINFLISTNAGESLKPLNKIASGGEISRIMLSFKRILSEEDNIECLIFDEIDTGISGQTANIVGKQMWQLSKNHQILAITHLPQIAVMGDSNYFIKKEVNEGKTSTSFTRLNQEEKANEIVRMISGEMESENAYSYSVEMLDNANNIKNL